MLSFRFCGESSPRRSHYINFEQAKNKQGDVAITLLTRFYYDQGISTALLVFLIRFSAFCPKFQSIPRSLPSVMRDFNFEHVQNKRLDVAFMTLLIHSYYGQVVSTALLAFSVQFWMFCLEFQSILRSLPSGMEIWRRNYTAGASNHQFFNMVMLLFFFFACNFHWKPI